jgi:hypothetical protein
MLFLKKNLECHPYKMIKFDFNTNMINIKILIHMIDTPISNMCKLTHLGHIIKNHF